ncbi:MAG: hypothetical protein GXO78_15060 [Calditrichaeota bacterium]|nr:hypothetical protein [Calditrichota bacterium]
MLKQMTFLILIAQWVMAGTGDSRMPFRELAGHWQGKGEIIVSWCQQDSLPFDLYIQADGTVSGRIGDAVIRDGALRWNRWWLRLLGNPDYVIHVHLEGPLVKDEGIVRKELNVLIDHSNDVLTGGFHSSGKKWGGRGRMKLSGSGVMLHRVP